MCDPGSLTNSAAKHVRLDAVLLLAIMSVRIGAVTDESRQALVSAAPAWELATRHRLGRLPSGEAAATNIADHIRCQGFVKLAISFAEAQRAGSFPSPHQGSLDRMLITQALAHDLTLVSVDKELDHYAVKRLR